MDSFFLRTIFIFLLFQPLWAQAENPVHNELRLVKKELEAAINKKDTEALMNLLHPNVVITWPNAEVSRKREGVKQYIHKMLFAENPIVKNFDTKFEVDELTILYGNDLGISFGSSNDNFLLREGLSFTSKSRWSATVVKENGKWYLASAHISANLFDNALLDLSKRSMYIAIAISLAAGIFFGFLIGKFKK